MSNRYLPSGTLPASCAPRASSVQEFGVQFDRDLVASVEGGVPSNSSVRWGRKIRGATSLRVEIPFSPN